MSAPFDLDIFQAFMRETGSTGFEHERGEDEAVRGALLYLCMAMADGGYCDFQFTFNTAEEDEMNGYYASSRAFLGGLTCRPLLQPWLEDREWGVEELTALKAKHAVTQALTNKEPR